MKNLCVLVLSLFIQVSVFAQTCTATGWRIWNGTDVYPTATDACVASAPKYDAKAHEGGANPGATYTFERLDAAGDCYLRYTPPTGTSNTFVLYNPFGPMSGSCPTPASPDAACAVKKGVTAPINFTEGYTRTPALTGNPDFVGPHEQVAKYLGTNQCIAGCSQKVGGLADVGEFWVSKQPSPQGLFRNSVDIKVTNNGTACTAGAPSLAAIDPLKPSPLCPGYVGEINGVKGCFGTADKPVNVVPGERPSKEPVAANPSAGAVPSSGEGSGTTGVSRTPSAGTGENNGGPASSAGAPRGTASAPAAGEVQAACGAPGQPRCRIDESGTPDGKGALSEGLTKLDDVFNSSKAGIDGSANIGNPTWSFTFQFPSGCSPYVTGIRGVILDVCRWQPMIHDLMAMVWAATAAFVIIGMVGRTIRES